VFESQVGPTFLPFCACRHDNLDTRRRPSSTARFGRKPLWTQRAHDKGQSSISQIPRQSIGTSGYMILFLTEHQDRQLRLVYLGHAPLLRLAKIYVVVKGHHGRRDDDTRLAKYKCEVIEKLMLMQVWRLRAQHPQYRVLNPRKTERLAVQGFNCNYLSDLVYNEWYGRSPCHDTSGPCRHECGICESRGVRGARGDPVLTFPRI
jgi:hypothetical protein